jgi:O-succinylbenzoic acid--CoA ligase
VVVVPRLVALHLTPGPAFVDALRRVWDDGDAALPLDSRHPRPHTEALLAALHPEVLLDDDGTTTALAGGRPVEPGDALVVATSGTTGPPKGAVHTHAGIEHAAFATATALGVGADVRWLACLPLSHVGGFSVVTRALLTGAGLEVHPRADAAAIDDAARRGATHVSLVPTLLLRIDPAPWRVILLGGAAPPPDRPGNTVATYGMTETFGGVVYDGLPLNGVGIRIAGADRLDPGEPGPVELSTPSLLRCYRDGTDPVDDRGWFRTGDLGTLDPGTGRLHVHGRADDVINTGGEKVWPTAVEDVLVTHPAVAEVAVYGEPDPEWGQRVVAVVVPADPAAPPGLGALRDLAKELLPAAAAPRELRLADSLPRTSLGKIARGALRDGPGTGRRGDTDGG